MEIIKEELECGLTETPKIPPTIFYPEEKGGKIPEECDTLVIKLDGRVKSDLDWSEGKRLATGWVEQDKRILWEIDLGLLNRLDKPIVNQPQFLSLTLSLEHFVDTVWSKFHEHTAGVCLYSGSGDFSRHFPWDDKQRENMKAWLHERCKIDSDKSTDEKILQALFCRDVAAEYLSLLASKLPDEVDPFLFLDAEQLEKSLEAHLFHREKWENFSIAVKNSKTNAHEFLQEGNVIRYYDSSEKKMAVCLPPVDLFHWGQLQHTETAISIIEKKGAPCRFIPENLLITEWHGLDVLFFHPDDLSSQGKRKLQGFCAAGGACVTLGEKMGLAQELTPEEFMINF